MTDWISVKDRLPYDYQYVLVYAKKEENEPSSISIARQFNGIWEMMNTEEQSNAVSKGDLTWYMDADEITHWMPLPNYYTPTT